MNISKKYIYIKIAGFKIKFIFQLSPSYLLSYEYYRKINIYYAGFMTDDSLQKDDYIVEFTIRDKYKLDQGDNLINISICRFLRNNYAQVYYHVSRLQFSLLLRLIIEKLLKNQGIFIHSSASLIKGKANLFLGNSGAGKSTISRMISTKYKILSDDLGVIKFEDGTFYYYQHHIIEKNNMIIKSSTRIPIGNIYLLIKSEKNYCEKIKSKREIYKLLLSQAVIEVVNRSQTNKFLIKFIKLFPNFSFLYFNKDKQSLINYLNDLTDN